MEWISPYENANPLYKGFQNSSDKYNYWDRADEFNSSKFCSKCYREIGKNTPYIFFYPPTSKGSLHFSCAPIELQNEIINILAILKLEK